MTRGSRIVAVEPVWYLPGVASRFGIDEGVLRRGLFEDTGGSYPELITRGDLKVFLPPIGTRPHCFYGMLADTMIRWIDCLYIWKCSKLVRSNKTSRSPCPRCTPSLSPFESRDNLALDYFSLDYGSDDRNVMAQMSSLQISVHADRI